jgi:hypothetical protein
MAMTARTSSNVGLVAICRGFGFQRFAFFLFFVFFSLPSVRHPWHFAGRTPVTAMGDI